MSYYNPPAGQRLAEMMCKIRMERGISLRQLADNAGVSPSVVYRAERGMDLRLSTWERLFKDGLVCSLEFDYCEFAEEVADLQAEEAERRRERRRQGLWLRH